MLLQTELSQQSGLANMAAVNFLASKMKQQKLNPVFKFFWISATTSSICDKTAHLMVTGSYD